MSTCQPFEDHLILHASEGRADAGWLRHLDQCSDCHARLERERRLVAELRGLSTASIPTELAELVALECAADGAGLRAGRAVASSMTDLGAPLELDARVESALTPAGAGERAGEHLSFLQRVPAPSELEGRVVAALHAGHREERAQDQVASLTPLRAPGVIVPELPAGPQREAAADAAWRRLALPPLIAAAAAVLLLFFVRGEEGTSATPRPATPTYSFQIVRLDVSQNPIAASLLNGIGGIRVEGQAR